MPSSDEKGNYLSPVQASQKRKLENMSQNIAGGTSLKDLTSAMSKLFDIKLKNLPTKSDVEGLKQELKSDIGWGYFSACQTAYRRQCAAMPSPNSLALIVPEISAFIRTDRQTDMARSTRL